MHKLFSQGLHSRNGLVRKGTAFLLQAPKRLSRPLAKPAAYQALPPVLANSFPKSGTHLLDQILEALPGRHSFGEFLSSMTSSYRFRRRDSASASRVLDASLPGEILRAHLFYDEAVDRKLRELNFVHYFIYRDLRDVAVSEAHYYRSINRWHRLHPLFRDVPTVDDAIMLAIRGIQGSNGNLYFPDIGMRFKHYEPWIRSSEVCAVRFEDLISDSREDHVRRLMEFFVAKSESKAEADDLVRTAIANIAPEKSHTFRSGQSGGWRSAFNDAHTAAFKAATGPLLVELGYEQAEDW